PKLRTNKLITKTAFEEALLLYRLHSFRKAAKLFEEVLNFNPEDRVAQIYLKRCQGIKSMDINNCKIDPTDTQQLQTALQILERYQHCYDREFLSLTTSPVIAEGLKVNS
ncbi:MAG TPA: hypothetical protein V6D48_25410, partial [Oculatellaceae cyanobacterium]